MFCQMLSTQYGPIGPEQEHLVIPVEVIRATLLFDDTSCVWTVPEVVSRRKYTTSP